MPGFIDPHGHLIPTSQLANMPDLSPVPIGDVSSIEDIKKKMRNMIDEYKIPAGGIVMAKGYDETLLSDGRALTRHDLDDISRVTIEKQGMRDLAKILLMGIRY